MVSMLHDLLEGAERLRLDPGFTPVFEGDERYRKAARDCLEVKLALVRDNGNVARADTRILPQNPSTDADTTEYFVDLVVRHLTNSGARTLLWSGPPQVRDMLNNAFYMPGATYAWVAEKLLPKTYGGFDIGQVEPGEIPSSTNRAEQICGLQVAPGRYLGVDIGRSNVRVVVIENGIPVYFQDTAWEPDTKGDAMSEILKLEQAVQKAVRTVGRVDGCAGGSAGVFLNNRMKIGMLVERIGEQPFNDILNRLDESYGTFKWLHDGVMQAIMGNILVPNGGSFFGIALGNDEGSGYISADGIFSTALHENAFHRINRNPNGFANGPSQPPGTAGPVFSQKGPNNLYMANGGRWEDLGVASDIHPRKKFLALRSRLNHDDGLVRYIASTVGAELAYAAPTRLEMFAPGTNILLGGKVMEGEFGAVLLSAAKQVFDTRYKSRFGSTIYSVEDPAFANLVNVDVRAAFERDGRSISDFGQAYAAAVLASRIRAGR